MTSDGAKGGFANENELITAINRMDTQGLAILELFGLEVMRIARVKATKASPNIKPDIDLEVFYGNGNGDSGRDAVSSDGPDFFGRISVKLVSSTTDFNQVDRGRVVDRYSKLWSHISSDAAIGLRHFTGDLKPYISGSKDLRRMFLNELSGTHLNAILDFFRTNKQQVVSDILMGREPNQADWLLVVDKLKGQTKLFRMEDAVAFYSQGPVEQSPRGSLTIGRVFMQRKGGDKGAESANDLQFKIHPTDIMNS